MKSKIQSFCLRGMIFGGLGPIVYSLVMFILFLSKVNITLDGKTIFLNVVSTYLLAFICAGISIIWKEERLGLSLQILIHGLSLYICYLIVYLINNWIPKNVVVLLIFTACFFVGYAIISFIVYLVEKNRAKKLNSYLK